LTYQEGGGEQVARDPPRAQERLAALMDEWTDAAEIAAEP
jgi:hypothetical protein